MVYDIAIIGGGIVGAATFYKLQVAYPDLNILLIDTFTLVKLIFIVAYLDMNLCL